MKRTTALTVIALGIVAGTLPAVAGAQSGPEVIGRTQDLDFDRPESWAMKRTAALTLLTSMGPPPELAAGQMELALDLTWNPSLSAAERRVGFLGNKEEDLNRLAVIPRPRLRVGLGRGFVLDAAYSPPLKVEGLEPNLLAVGVERALWRSDHGWSLGARVHGQMGEIEGDITCPGDVAALPPGEPGNRFGCREPSDDEMDMDLVGAGLTGGYRWPGERAPAVHFGLLATYTDLAFQVDALTFDVRDRNRLETDGWIYTAVLGGSFSPAEHVGLAVEASYTPLDVVRPHATSSQDDGLLTARALVSYAF